MLNQKLISIDLSKSHAYVSSSSYWGPLLAAHAKDTGSEEADTFEQFVRTTLLPLMESEQAGKKIIEQLRKSGMTQQQRILALAHAARTKELLIFLTKDRFAVTVFKFLTSPLSLASAVGMLMVGSAHIYAFFHGIEIQLIYAAPVMNIAVLFFIVPVVYNIFKRLLK